MKPPALEKELTVVDCFSINSMPNVTFNIAGSPFRLTPQDYVLQLPGGKCLLGFVGASSLDDDSSW